jgi:hypothetical protein
MKHLVIALALAFAPAGSPARADDCGYVGRLHAGASFSDAAMGGAYASAGVVLDGGCNLLSGTGWMSGWCNAAYGQITFDLGWAQPGYQLTSDFSWQDGVVTFTGGVTGTAVMTADVTAGQTCLPATQGAHDFVITVP